MKAIVAFRKSPNAAASECYNVAGNNQGRIDSIVESYRYQKGYRISQVKYNKYEPGLEHLTNYKGTSYIK